MSKYKVKSPVAFIVFNRPETTRKVFEQIKAVKPERLLVVADGPRKDRLGEASLCDQVRDIIGEINWDCDVAKNYSEHNLGCKRRVSSGLDWVFERVEEAIILEDDCLPHPTFFRFCDEMLERYRYDERIGHIGGVNYQPINHKIDSSYYFSRYAHVWGWATWRRVWQTFDVDMKSWPGVAKNKLLKKVFRNDYEVKYWSGEIQSVYAGKVDTWDLQWNYCGWMNNRLSILPNVNLVTNIGFGEDATHTKEEMIYSNVPSKRMEFPLIEPEYLLTDTEADLYTNNIMFGKSLVLKIIHKIKNIFI